MTAVPQLQQEGKKVCFVGDGINDSIALKKSNVSVAQLTDLFEVAQEFKTNINGGCIKTIIPNLLGIAGTLFLGCGYLTAVTLGTAFWVPQLAYVMRPLYQHRASPELAEAS